MRSRSVLLDSRFMATFIALMVGYVLRPVRAKTAVQTVVLQRGGVERKVMLRGTVWPKSRVTVSVAPNARVMRVLVARGQRVRQGQRLADLDLRPLQLQVQRRKLALERARAQLRGSLEATVSSATHATQETEFDVAQAQLELGAAEDALRASRLEAPMSGVVVQINVREGELVPPSASGAGAIVIAEGNGSYIVEVEGDEFEVAQVRPGARAVAFVPAAGPAPLLGQVLEEPVLKRMSAVGNSTFGFVVELTSAPPIFVFGFGARVEVVLDRKDDTVIAPLGSVLRLDNRDYLVAVNADRYSKVPVQVGLTDDHLAELIEGPVGITVAVATSQSGLAALLK